MKEKLTLFTFTACWQKGSLHYVSNALSRSPIPDPCKDEVMDESDLLHVAVAATLCAVDEDGCILAPFRDMTLEKVRESGYRDAEYVALRDIIMEGFPKSKRELSLQLRPYWAVQGKLAVDDDLFVFGSRLVIPRDLRREVLDRLHDGHQGMDRTKRRAR